MSWRLFDDKEVVVRSVLMRTSAIRTLEARAPCGRGDLGIAPLEFMIRTEFDDATIFEVPEDIQPAENIPFYIPL